MLCRGDAVKASLNDKVIWMAAHAAFGDSVASEDQMASAMGVQTHLPPALAPTNVRAPAWRRALAGAVAVLAAAVVGVALLIAAMLAACVGLLLAVGALLARLAPKASSASPEIGAPQGWTLETTARRA